MNLYYSNYIRTFELKFAKTLNIIINFISFLVEKWFFFLEKTFVQTRGDVRASRGRK